MLTTRTNIILFVILALFAQCASGIALESSRISPLVGTSTATGYSARSLSHYQQILNSTNSPYIFTNSFFGNIINSSHFAISEITPASGYNTTPISVVIKGVNFDQTANYAITLSKDNETSILGSNPTIESSTEISCTFDLVGKAVGNWNVSVSANGITSTIANGFEIKTSGAAKNVAINSPNPFNPFTETTTIMYSLDQDANVDLYIFSTTGKQLYKRTYAAGTNGGKQGQNNIIWNGKTDLGDTISNGIYLMQVVSTSKGIIAKGKIAVLAK